MGVPMNLVFAYAPSDERLLAIEMLFYATATAVDPATGTAAAETRKPKIFKITAVLDTTNPDDPLVRGNAATTEAGGLGRAYRE
jgi:hypothetical protein